MQPVQNHNPTPGWVTFTGSDGIQPISAKVEVEEETGHKYITTFWQLTEEEVERIKAGSNTIALTTLHGLPPHNLRLVDTIE